ncbi:hypothetical protein [Shewanella sp. S1-58-MNA-CIBAN-0166]|uniref:hypothetical protein n=1 Tax=Shewanella sp. S1-58-MNA-CIBAN-0166 TaxID=3140467 RepID=UPI0033314A97
MSYAATVSGAATTNTFAYMFIGAKHMLEQAEESEIGQLYNIVSCLTYCAFTLEAYFNHFGKLQNDDWDNIERNYSKLKKYKKFCKDLDLSIDFKKPPYSSLIEIFSYRDQMAHGKSTIEFVTKEVELEIEKPNEFRAGAGWQEYATIDNAKKALEHTSQIISELHIAAGYGDKPFNKLGSGLFGVSINRNITSGS